MGLGSIRIRVVTSRDEILGLGIEEKAVHLAFRPSDRDLFNLVKTCPGIELLQLPASSYDALSKFIKMYLASSGIHLVKGDVSGHWHDLNNYFVIPAYGKKVTEKLMCHRIIRCSFDLKHGYFIRYCIVNLKPWQR